MEQGEPWPTTLFDDGTTSLDGVEFLAFCERDRDRQLCNVVFAEFYPKYLQGFREIPYWSFITVSEAAAFHRSPRYMYQDIPLRR